MKVGFCASFTCQRSRPWHICQRLDSVAIFYDSEDTCGSWYHILEWQGTPWLSFETRGLWTGVRLLMLTTAIERTHAVHSSMKTMDPAKSDPLRYSFPLGESWTALCSCLPMPFSSNLLKKHWSLLKFLDVNLFRQPCTDLLLAVHALLRNRVNHRSDKYLHWIGL